ncbi:hypothetical protein T4A_11368 [Trichinella pseudospiralis]|uniref:Uncharacterized protein n=1 Tax=Trichinella pseudospiralis TaxID=6337 RepID=A0A0V1DZA3_TRIPS|nr:hypothetical protein T4A_11368 [Trichinella pseudospiralis]
MTNYKNHLCGDTVLHWQIVICSATSFGSGSLATVRGRFAGTATVGCGFCPNALAWGAGQRRRVQRPHAESRRHVDDTVEHGQFGCHAFRLTTVHLLPEWFQGAHQQRTVLEQLGLGHRVHGQQFRLGSGQPAGNLVQRFRVQDRVPVGQVLSFGHFAEQLVQRLQATLADVRVLEAVLLHRHHALGDRGQKFLLLLLLTTATDRRLQIDVHFLVAGHESVGHRTQLQIADHVLAGCRAELLDKHALADQVVQHPQRPFRTQAGAPSVDRQARVAGRVHALGLRATVHVGQLLQRDSPARIPPHRAVRLHQQPAVVGQIEQRRRVASFANVAGGGQVGLAHCRVVNLAEVFDQQFPATHAHIFTIGDHFEQIPTVHFQHGRSFRCRHF